MEAQLVLASGSAHRRELLEHAGVKFRAVPSTVDERAVEASFGDAPVSPEDIAVILAEAKAMDVSQRMPGSIVIGADQTLALGDELLHKPETMEDARRTLLRLSGKAHKLYSAYVIVRDGVVLKRKVADATIIFRELSPVEIGQYLAKVGSIALTSVGAYQIEGRGLRLMESIEGDYFTIVGLPMLPLLKDLAELGALND